MLRLVTLDESRICHLYENRMRRDFPPSELKRLSSIIGMVRKDEYDVIGAYEGDEFAAYALVYRPQGEGVVLLDYLAVDENRRGRGIGTMLLGQLRSYYSEKADVILIECERPLSAPDEIGARKRIRFYARSGAVLTNVRIWLFEVEYSILVLPCASSDVPHKDWAQQMLTLYRQMLPQELYETNVRLLRG